ncbi:DNA polymerase eta isoform X2 [Physcomitrium patens]|uniref:DNA polymerase eta isoform X2 n=1 Tax=Physcomitrium patens TaxID=3218 RepID=UPI000D15D127|nr:DNA polymerase eta-like isoform X2 [Physcomitrium patens]|eukprot:XP_024382887.1 DNA polymerase eta-like isoform X2 [Physcomitrella patens]
MPVARPDSGETRVIAHLDLDCFYVQVEQRKRPELRGKPVAVVQFNPWKGGGLIAVSYEARKCGVLRCMRGDDAKKMCPDIELVQVPTAHGHANVNYYRDAGTEVVEVLSRGGICERASIDEVYLDITEAAAARLIKGLPSLGTLSEEARKTHILGLEEDGENAMTAGEWLCQSNVPRCDALLACGALIVAELRAAVLAETQFTCSAGIGHNKMLAKLTSSMHKPAQQTLIPSSYVPTLLATIPLKKIGHLGGKLGKSLTEDLGVKTPGDLIQFSKLKLQELYGVNTGNWLWDVARGKNGDEVKAKVLPKSISCGKTFAGRTALTNMTSVMYWLGEMCDELQEKLDIDLEVHNRKAKLLVFHAAVQLRGGNPQPGKKFPSKSCPIRYGKEKILADARILFERGLRDFCPVNKSLSPVKGSSNSKCEWAVTALSIGAGGISTIPTGVNSITSFFAAPPRSPEANLSASSPVSPTMCRMPSSDDLEGMAGFLSDGVTKDEECGTLISCSSGERPSCRNLFHSDDDANPDFDVKCTPSFGCIGSPVRQKSSLELSRDHEIPRGCIANPCSSLDGALIQCSPVEDHLSVHCRVETDSHTCAVVSIDSHPVDISLGMKYEATLNPCALGIETEEKASGVVHSHLARSSSKPLAENVNPPSSAGGHGSLVAKATSSPKLKDLWQRNVLKRPSGSWEYRQDEIDEEVLAELPAEIQKELLDSMKRNRAVRPVKRSNIGR